MSAPASKLTTAPWAPVFRFWAMAAALALPPVGCGRRPTFTAPLTLGGQTVLAETLNEGRDAYTHYCRACHGEKGDGQGPSSPGMRPAPRDFTTGMFKFAGVAAGELPHDEDLTALVKRGLAGTPMLPWDISDRERTAIVQYIKTFSDRWKTETPGDRIVPPIEDPWVGKETLAIEQGKRLYHLTGLPKVPAPPNTMPTVFLACGSCHPHYLTKDQLSVLSDQVVGAPPSLRDDMFRPALKESDYRSGDHKLQILPVDFLFHQVKNGTDLPDLYRSIACGIGGTAMPNWSAVKPDDLWALVHYVKSLIDLRGTREGNALTARLTASPAQ